MNGGGGVVGERVEKKLEKLVSALSVRGVFRTLLNVYDEEQLATEDSIIDVSDFFVQFLSGEI